LKKNKDIGLKMECTTKGMMFKDIVEGIYKTYEKKNKDYGDSFDILCNKFGLVAAAIPLNNKVERINSLIKNNKSYVNESIEDSLLDLANYAIMTLIYLKNNGENK
jgi:hypothetical protein